MVQRNYHKSSIRKAYGRVLKKRSISSFRSAYSYPERTMTLKGVYEEEFRRAADQDEDRASLRVVPYHQGY